MIKGKDISELVFSEKDKMRGRNEMALGAEAKVCIPAVSHSIFILLKALMSVGDNAVLNWKELNS